MIFGGENAESYYDEGLTASMKGDLELAIECFEKALKLDRRLTSASHQLAKCVLRMGHVGRAVDILIRVVREKPQLIPPRLDLGGALLALGRLEEAQRIFSEVLAAEPANARALMGMGQVAFALGNWAGAMDFAKQSIANSGPSFPSLFLLGRAARLSGDAALANSTLEEAAELIDKSLEGASDQPESYFLRGEVKFALENFSEALDYYRSATDRAKPRQVYSAFGGNFTQLDLLARQGLCHQRLWNKERAREIGEEILSKDPTHEVARSLIEPDEERAR